MIKVHFRPNGPIIWDERPAGVGTAVQGKDLLVFDKHGNVLVSYPLEYIVSVERAGARILV